MPQLDADGPTRGQQSIARQRAASQTSKLSGWAQKLENLIVCKMRLCLNDEGVGCRCQRGSRKSPPLLQVINSDPISHKKSQEEDGHHPL